jgi:hypothetical protein
MINSKLRPSNLMLRINYSEDNKIIISIFKKGISLIDVHKAKLSLTKKGITFSDSHKLVISIVMTDKVNLIELI